MRSFQFYFNIAYHLLVFLPLKIFMNVSQKIQKKVTGVDAIKNGKIREYKIISKSKLPGGYSNMEDFVYVSRRDMSDIEAKDVLLKNDNISLFSLNQSEAVFVRSTKVSIFTIPVFHHFSSTLSINLQKILYLYH